MFSNQYGMMSLKVVHHCILSFISFAKNGVFSLQQAPVCASYRRQDLRQYPIDSKCSGRCCDGQRNAAGAELHEKLAPLTEAYLVLSLSSAECEQAEAPPSSSCKIRTARRNRLSQVHVTLEQLTAS
jgi:hypothetical protein